MWKPTFRALSHVAAVYLGASGPLCGVHAAFGHFISLCPHLLHTYHSWSHFKRWIILKKDSENKKYKELRKYSLRHTWRGLITSVGNETDVCYYKLWRKHYSMCSAWAASHVLGRSPRAWWSTNVSRLPQPGTPRWTPQELTPAGRTIPS